MRVHIDCFRFGLTKADYDALSTILSQVDAAIVCEVNDKTQSTINDSVVCRIMGGTETDRNRLQPLIEATIRSWLGNGYTNIILRCSEAEPSRSELIG